MADMSVSDQNFTDDVLLNEDISQKTFYTKKEAFVTQKVTQAEQNLRLDKFLTRQCDGLSRNQLIRCIEDGGVSRITGEKITRPDYRVKADEIFSVVFPRAQEADPLPENIPLDVLFEDDDLIVINKPAGLVVHPGAGNWNGTLVNALLAHCRESLSGIGGVKRPGIVHRIDKDTSGILVVAKNDFAHVHLSEQFSQHTIERVYQAFVWGLPPVSGEVVGNVGRSPVNRQKMAVVKTGGKHAVTHYERQAAYLNGKVSLVRCVLETGRTHQIRVHLSSIGHSLVGDRVYGSIPAGMPDFLRYFPRQALHAGFLGFIHPRTKERLSFSAPFPDDLKCLEQELLHSA